MGFKSMTSVMLMQCSINCNRAILSKPLTWVQVNVLDSLKVYVGNAGYKLSLPGGKILRS